MDAKVSIKTKTKTFQNLNKNCPSVLTVSNIAGFIWELIFITKEKMHTAHCTKSQTFSNSCAQNRHDLLAKIVKHIDGTSGAEHGCNMDWTLVASSLVGCSLVGSGIVGSELVEIV